MILFQYDSVGNNMFHWQKWIVDNHAEMRSGVDANETLSRHLKPVSDMDIFLFMFYILKHLTRLPLNCCYMSEMRWYHVYHRNIKIQRQHKKCQEWQCSFSNSIWIFWRVNSLDFRSPALRFTEYADIIIKDLHITSLQHSSLKGHKQENKTSIFTGYSPHNSFP